MADLCEVCIEAERAEFERWMILDSAGAVPDDEVTRRKPDGAYAHSVIQSRWCGWMARAQRQRTVN